MAFWICFTIVGTVFVLLLKSTRSSTPFPPGKAKEQRNREEEFFEDIPDSLDTYLPQEDEE